MAPWAGDGSIHDKVVVPVKSSPNRSTPALAMMIPSHPDSRNFFKRVSTFPLTLTREGCGNRSNHCALRRILLVAITAGVVFSGAKSAFSERKYFCVSLSQKHLQPH